MESRRHRTAAVERKPRWNTGSVPWATAPLSSPSQPTAQAQPGLGAAATVFNDQTLRQIVHTSLGGDRVRIVLSNAFGTSPLAIGAAHIALREKDAAIVARRPIAR